MMIAPHEASFESDAFRRAFGELLAWRRDVRHFRRDPLAQGVLEALIDAAHLAPSVGLSQPWRFASVTTPEGRARVRENFERCNADALAGYKGEQAGLYSRMKLAGLDDAPAQLAVFCEMDTASGHGLGRRTMPETLEYSVVTAVHTMWLVARTLGLGVGWVSILDAGRLNRDLDLPPSWKLVAYLCIGFPMEESLEPDLERRGWERRTQAPPPVLIR